MSVVNNFIHKGFFVTNTTKQSIELKNSNGSIIYVKPNNKIEGLIKEKIIDNPLSEGKISKNVSVLILMGLSLTYFTTDFTIVYGHSMEPNLKNFEVFINSKINVKKVIRHGTVVKFKDFEGDICLKRVLGIPGDKVKITENGLEINGKVVDKDTSWITGKNIEVSADRSTSDNVMEYILSDDEYFVLGDNRENSTDSRAYGPIKKTHIMTIVIK